MSLEGFGDIFRLVEHFDTPLMVYSEHSIQESVGRLRDMLPERSRIAYSVKANPNPSILRVLNGLGLMVEAASAGELALALRSGYTAANVLLGGPAKRAEALRFASEAGVCAIMIESRSELERLSEECCTSGRTARILLRVNPVRLASASVLRMTGLASQFGIDEAELPAILPFLTKPGIDYCGLFLYAGSQCFDARSIIANTRYLCSLANRLCDVGFPPPRIIDFGGGFGVPEDHSQGELDEVTLRMGLDKVLADDLPELVASGLETAIFESGRFVVARAGIYVARVVDVKRSQGRLFAILDGGLNNLGIKQLLYRTYEPRVELLTQRKPSGGEPVTLVGPSCTPIDVLHRECALPGIAPGDLVLIRDAGAYSISYSPVCFCGHPTPAEVMVRMNGEVHLTRERGDIADACGVNYTYR